ncbi:hypothetical protein GCM10023093_08680 [Nemorincola caseinilytica]|uniref:YfhO family protein n=1 Tax=Nemorincola caseinilytica TaxID=2054315 RepID=A0ABP8N8M9_9BACT
MSAKKKQNVPAKPAPPIQETPAAKVTFNVHSTPVADLFDTLGKKAAFVALGLLAVIAFIVYRHYLSLEHVFFFKDIGSDTYNYTYPTIYSVAAQNGIPSWSFNRAMGQSMYPFSLRDPFEIFMYLAGAKNLIYATIFKEFAKVVLGGWVFYYYLRTVGFTAYTCIIGSICFAFCGFMVMGGTWALFSFEAFNLALLLLAFEQLLSKGKWLLFPIAIFLLAISQPFNLFVYGLFLAGYAILRMYQLGTYTFRSGTVLFVQMIGFGAIGMLLGGFMLLENIVQLLESPRGSGNTSYASALSSVPMFQAVDKFQLGTAVMRLFCTDLLGAAGSYKGWQNTLEAPLFYCGLPCLLLMPQVFPLLEKKKRLFFVVFLLIWLIPVFFPYFRYSFWLFTGDYYRAYSIVVAGFFMYYALVALDLIIRHQRVSLLTLGITLGVLFLLLNYPYFPEGEFINSALLTFVCFMLLVYGALLFFIGRQGSPVYLRYVLLAALAFEVIYFSSISVNDRDPVTAEELTQKKGYNDHTIDALDAINKVDHSFYRVDKAYGSSPAIHYSLNDGMAQNYHGTSGYNPFNQLYYIRYLQLMGVSDKNNEQDSRWARGLAGRPILESQNRVRYMMDKGFAMPIWRVTADSIGTFGDVRLFRSKYLLPFGYAYSRYIKESAFNTLSTTQKDFVSLRACVVADDKVASVQGMQEFRLADTIPAMAFNLDIYKQYVDELGHDSMADAKVEDTRITGKVTVGAAKMLYLTVPYDEGWHLSVDGKPREKDIVFAGMTGVSLAPGTHTIEMTYSLRYLGKGTLLTILGLVAYAALWFIMRRRKLA